MRDVESVSRECLGILGIALFLLMFRSERLDWSAASLSAAGAASFALLTQAEAESAGAAHRTPVGVQTLVVATERWSLMHGLATLVIDGRLEPVANRLVPGADMEKLIGEALASSLRPNRSAR